MAACAQIHIRITSDHFQQEPDLLLATVMTTPFAPNPVVRHFITQPLACATDDPDMFGQQADLFGQLPIHRLLGGLATLYPPLRELPGMLSYPLAPEDLVAAVDQ